MGIYNFQYDPRTDPKALIAEGLRNALGGFMQGQQKKRLGEAISKIGQNATPIEVAMMLLSEKISPQIAMGLGGLQQRMQPNIGAIPWASTQMTPAQRQRWLDNYGQSITIQTGQKLLEPGQRQEIAEADFKEKVGLSTTESSNALKGIENIIESTPGSPVSYGWKDYSREKVIGMYKQWLTEQAYETRTPRQKKRLDDIWDGKIKLTNKMGFRYKDRNKGKLSKNEIWWDPADPEVRKLREVQTEEGIAQTNSAIENVLQGITEPPAETEQVDQARLQQLEGWLQNQTEPKELIDDLKSALAAIGQGADTSAVFDRVIEEYKDRPELQQFIAQVLKPFVK